MLIVECGTLDCGECVSAERQRGCEAVGARERATVSDSEAERVIASENEEWRGNEAARREDIGRWGPYGR